MTNVKRRTVLLGGAVAAGGAALWALPSRVNAAEPAIRFPFTLGVASGDPLPDSVVLWTRLAPEPLSTGGLGRVPAGTYGVSWEMSTDANFATIAASGVETAIAEDGYSVHAIPRGLQPGAWYYYRFKVQSHISPVGRTRTAPAPDSTPSSLTFAFASCQHWEQGYYHAHRFLAADNPDLVLWLGDYIYEYAGNVYKAPADRGVRSYSLLSESDVLADYRQRYAQHKTDPNLKAAHAAAPWVCVFDDHELKNNWAGNDTSTTSPEPGAPPISATRKFEAFKAWWENMPTRMLKPTGASITPYRTVQWGTLARFHMLDTRQFRDDQAPDGNCTVMRSTTRSILGTQQENDLLAALATQPARWDFLGQQVFFAGRDSGGDSADCNDMSTDAWDGYDASRRRIAQGWVDRSVRNPVVLTGDVHRHWAANLHLNYYTGGAVVGTEFVTSSISSLGSATAPDLSKMPHIRYIGNQRGYVRCTLTPGQLLGEWIGVSSALSKNPTGITSSVVRRYAVMDGVPGLQTA